MGCRSSSLTSVHGAGARAYELSEEYVHSATVMPLPEGGGAAPPTLPGEVPHTFAHRHAPPNSHAEQGPIITDTATAATALAPDAAPVKESPSSDQGPVKAPNHTDKELHKASAALLEFLQSTQGITQAALRDAAVPGSSPVAVFHEVFLELVRAMERGLMQCGKSLTTIQVKSLEFSANHLNTEVRVIALQIARETAGHPQPSEKKKPKNRIQDGVDVVDDGKLHDFGSFPVVHSVEEAFRGHL
eukprot:RCo035044